MVSYQTFVPPCHGLLSVGSFGVLASALMVAGVVAGVGLAHYLLWGHAFVRGGAREAVISKSSLPIAKSRPTTADGRIRGQVP